MVYIRTPPSLWDVNTQWDAIPRDVLLSCPQNVVETLEWCSQNSIQQHTENWFKVRNEQIIVSGSILNTIVGENKYEPPERVFLDKIGRHPSPFTGNEATKWGNDTEDEAYLKWCQREKVYGFTIGLIFDRTPGFGYRGGSPDGIDNRARLVEIKCPFRRWIKPGVVPEHYTYQPQFYMKLFELQKAMFVQYKPERLTHSCDILDAVEVDYDANRINRALDIAHVFANDVMECRRTGIVPATVAAYRNKEVIKRFRKRHGRAAKLDTVLQDLNDLYLTDQSPVADLSAEPAFMEMFCE